MTFSDIPSLQLIPGAISEIVANVANSGCLQEGDRYGLMAACLDEELAEEERLAVNRLLHWIARGKVEIC